MKETGEGRATAPFPTGNRVQRLVGKDPGSWTIEDLVSLAIDQRVRTVSLMHVGGDGWLKTLDFVPRDESHLHDILEAGERADGSSLFAGLGIEAGASDIVLHPRLHTAFFDPFAPHPTLCFLCGHLGRDGKPLPQSPDTILRAADRRLRKEMDLELLALGEVEYFLGKRAEESDIYGADDRGYHATSPFVFGEALRRRAMAVLGDMRVAVKYGHSEVGYIGAVEPDDLIWEQHEIEMSLRPLPDAAECVLLAQWVLRNLAHDAGMRCSFDPVLREGHAGSGMHFHFSPTRDGEHLGDIDENGAGRDEARWLIGGLASMGGALMAWGNRSPQSFTRLRGGKETPTAITWGRYNRHALIRVPTRATSPDGRYTTPPTIEFRLPDGSVHPYLLLAGVAQAMMHGRGIANLEELLRRTRASEDTVDAPGIPASNTEVASQLEAAQAPLAAGGVFPTGLLSTTIDELRACTDSAFFDTRNPLT